VELDWHVEDLQQLPENRRAGNAVGVVVAVNANFLLGPNGVVQPVGRRGDAGQPLRRVQAGKWRIEETSGDTRSAVASDCMAAESCGDKCQTLATRANAVSR
jgi:hypothetical protein